MKKLIALIAVLALCVSCVAFAGAEATDPNLPAARSYLRLMYKNSPETTMVDYDVVGVVNIGGVEYPVTWTADSETVKIIVNDNKTVTIDVDEKNPEEVAYTLTGTITGANGETASVSFKHKVPAAMILEGLSYEEIVAAAYTLEDGLAMEETQRLCGTVIRIPTAWSPDYKNITVDIQIGDLVDQPIQCYRLSGEGAENLKVGDRITVEGILKNYKGTIEFDKGCVLVGYGEIASQKALVDAAYALEDGAAMPNATALEGEIVAIDTAWSDEYKNITVSIVCDGLAEQKIMCYRLSGEGAATLAVGDKIGVYGTIKNYKGTIEFDKGCLLIPYGTATMARTVLAAYQLEDQMSMNAPETLTGVIVKIPTAYSPDYKNITVDMVVAGMENNIIQCYRLAGEGADTLQVGDTITVTGTIKNYKGTIEFDKGCSLDAVVKSDAVPVEPIVIEPADDAALAELLNTAYALVEGDSMFDKAKLTGEIVSIDTAYSEQYGNITVTIVCGGKTEQPIMCYRLKGEGAADLAVGDTITVLGNIKNYKGTIEYDAGCTLEAVVK